MTLAPGAVASGLPHPAEVAERLVEAAPGPCVAIVEDAYEVDARFAVNTVTTDGARFDRRVTAVRLAPSDGGRPGASGTARRSGDVDVRSLLAEAGAHMSEAGDASALVDGGRDPDFGAEPVPTTPERLDGVLSGLGGAFARAERAGTVLSGFAEHAVVTTYLASTTGLRRRTVQPTGSLQLVGRREGSSAWAGRGTADFADVEVDALDEEVRRRLGWASTRVELPAGRYEVVLEPSAVADLMLFLVDAASGRESEDGRTVFSRPSGATALGEQLTPLPFDLWSDPAAAGIECAPFLATSASGADVSVFDNGAALHRTDWLRAGRLERLRYHRAGAARAGTVPTFPVDNLALALPGATGTVDDLVAATERGLLLTCLWYIREVDPKTLLLTGLTRDGVYVVEGGRVVGEANNFRFNESPLDVLARATAASRTVRTYGREGGSWLNRTAMPGLRVPGWNMSTVSQAV